MRYGCRLPTTSVSLMSHRGVSIEEIARLVGHASTRTSETVYRRELRPVITTGAEIMDEFFSRPEPLPVREPPRTRTQPAADPWLPDTRLHKRSPPSRYGSPSRNAPIRPSPPAQIDRRLRAHLIACEDASA
jgi:hypothetical protein